MVLMALCTLMAWLLVQSASGPETQEQDGRSDCGLACEGAQITLLQTFWFCNNPGLVIGPSDSWHLSKRCKLVKCKSPTRLAPLADQNPKECFVRSTTLKGVCRKAERLKWRHMSSKPQKTVGPRNHMSCSLWASRAGVSLSILLL